MDHQRWNYGSQGQHAPSTLCSSSGKLEVDECGSNASCQVLPSLPGHSKLEIFLSNGLVTEIHVSLGWVRKVSARWYRGCWIVPYD